MKPYYETELGKLYHGDCLEIMPQLPLIDLVITSPPYDELRDYCGYSFDYKRIAFELFGIIALGGVVVWIVGDQTINGSETGTSFRQALYFKDQVGFNIHDTMIYEKAGFANPSNNRYHQVFEYMFIFSKSTPKTFNPLEDRQVLWGKMGWGKQTSRQKDGSLTKQKNIERKRLSNRFNIWKYGTGKGFSSTDNIAFDHPAIFPETLAQDHILSWSNKNDIVLDPMCGSGTTCKMAEKLGRRWIGIEIEEKYCEIAAKRIDKERQQFKLF